MKKLMRRIKKEIKEKTKKYVTGGTENLSITLILTDNEISEFQTVNLDNHYIYDLEEHELCINYVEEVSACMNVYVDNLSQVFDLKKLEEVNRVFEYNNKPLWLIQDAGLSNLAGHEDEYTALAIDKGGRLYNIIWDILDLKTVDAADTCDWNKYTVRKM